MYKLQSLFLDAIILWGVSWGGLSLYSALAQENHELVAELSSAIRAYDANLDALRSNIFVDDTLQSLRWVILLRKRTALYLLKSLTKSMANLLLPRDVSRTAPESP